MKPSTLITHAAWAVLAVGAFMAGRSALSEQWGVAWTAAGDRAGTGSRSVARRSEAAAWTSGPGDSPGEFSAEMAAVLSEADEELQKPRALDLMEELTPQVLEGLTEEMVPGLLQALELAGGGSGHQIEEVLRRWTRLNPGAAFAFVMDPANENQRRTAVILEWARIDLAAARNAVIESPHYQTTYHLMDYLQKTDLDAALAFSARLQTETNATPSMRSLMHRLHRERGREGVQGLLDGIAASDYKRKAVEALAGLPGPAVVEILAANADDPIMNSALILEIAETARSSRGQNRTLKALDWVANLPEEIGPRREAIGIQFEKYMKADFEGAGAWLAGQQLNARHDEAIRVFARNATMDDVPTAMRWAERISDSKLRAETVKFIQERGGQ